jgi:MYXO-CTERM domain-containing protein
VGRARIAAATALGIAIATSAETAGAFCRTTTCDVDTAKENCTWDADGCATAGEFLFWPDSCAWFGVQQDGSPKRHITYATAHAAIANAFGKWGKANCGNGHPSFAIDDTDGICGPVVCNKHEFDQKTANASVWMFRDDGWPYVGATTTIALTTLSVQVTTGRILDADVEINSFGTDITTSETNVVADLDSIVTHESGHYLGLAHSPDAASTMYASYSPASVSIRSLSPDDEAAICAAYPASKPQPMSCVPEPRYGYSKYCKGVNPCTLPEQQVTKGCTVALGAPAGSGAAAATLLVVGLAARRRRRSTWV